MTVRFINVIGNSLRPGTAGACLLFVVVLLLPSAVLAAESPAAGCEAYVPLTSTEQEQREANFRPGGIKPFLLGILAGPRIALEWNDGRGVRGIELFRSIPYLGNVVGLFLCVEALSGYRMTAVAAETGIDDWRRDIYFKRIAALEAAGEFSKAAKLRQCTPFDTFNHPPNPRAVKPDERTGMAKWKSGLAGLLIDNRVGLEREESRGIRGIEYWSILRLPSIIPAIRAARGKKMSEVVRERKLDEAWLEERATSPHDGGDAPPSHGRRRG